MPPPNALRNMGRVLGSMFNRRTRVRPTKTEGTIGVPIYGGYIVTQEKHPSLATPDQRYRTYSDLLANTSIAAAGVRYFLNLIGGTQWQLLPAVEGDAKAQEYADLATQMLIEDPATPWHRVTRRMSMYRFWGFSIQEWTAIKRDDGRMTFADIEPRAQRTISRWDVDDAGKLYGVVQRAPQTGRDIYLPRAKVVYAVDDTLNDSPEGLGIFRHLARPARSLKRIEQLEGFGFEMDLSGIPLIRMPLIELAKAVKKGEISQKQADLIRAPLEKFLTNHIRNPRQGILLDSMVYHSTGDRETPSSQRQWDVEILTGSPTSFEPAAAAIERLNREMARILGIEQLLLGSSGGSYAMSKDKTHNFYLLVDSALTEMRDVVRTDLLKPLWMLNGFDEDLMPTISTESVRFMDGEEITTALRNLALAALDEDDPAIKAVRSLLGLPPPPERTQEELDERAMRDAKPLIEAIGMGDRMGSPREPEE